MGTDDVLEVHPCEDEGEEHDEHVDAEGGQGGRRGVDGGYVWR